MQRLFIVLFDRTGMRMNAVTKNFTDVLRHPSARLTQHLRIWIGKRALDLDVLDFKVRGGLCKDYRVDITVTSPRLDIDGKEYVGRRAGLQVDERAAVPSASWSSPVDHAAATFNGVVTRWKRVRTSRDEAAYQMRLEPRFAALGKLMVHSDVLENVTFEEMVRQLMVDGQNFDAFDIEFHLEGPQEKMEQVVMYEESRWDMVTRHAKRKGIFWFYRQERGENGLLDILVFADNPRAYIRSVNLPLLAGSGLHSNWHEAAQAVHEQRTLVPATVELWERNYRTPADPLRATANVSTEAGDRTVFGQISRGAEFHLTPAQGEALAQTRRDEQIARQVTLAGKTDAKCIAPGVVVKLTNTTMPSAEYGFVVTAFRMEGSRTKPAYTRFKAMPAHLAYRPRFSFERDWRFLGGPVVGVVTTLDSAPYAYVDDFGRYPVLPKFLQGTVNTNNRLLNLRLLRPSSSYQGGSVSGVTPVMIAWREQVGAEGQRVTPEATVAPADSAGYYWAKMGMGRYADRPTALERRAVTATRPPDPHHPHPNPPVGKVYYHSMNFRDASAIVNLPSAVGQPNRPFNGYIARCVAYAQALAVLAEVKFPDASGGPSFGFPEGRTPRRD
jgi:type VI secretion system secreted protein VgrG